jgi:hypothetical protein
LDDSTAYSEKDCCNVENQDVKMIKTDDDLTFAGALASSGQP